MTLAALYVLLAVGAGVVLISVGAAKLAARLGMPVLLAFLCVGLLLGQDVAGVPFDDAALAQALGLAALALILVEGGLTTTFSDIRTVLAPASALSTIGVLVSVAVTAAAARLLLQIDWQIALLLGAIVSSTDAAAVFSVLRTVPLPRQLSGLIEAESGLNDAPTFLLVAALSTTTLPHLSPLPLAVSMLVQLIAGGLIGIAVGAAAARLLRRLTLPASGLHPIATVASGILAFAVAGLAQTSGFLAAYLAGLVLGNAGLPHRRVTRSVAQGLGWIAQIGLFVMLGLLATPTELPSAIVPALVIGTALLLLARPASVAVSLTPFRVPWREQVFLSWAGLRGAVPVVLATVPVVAAAPGSDQVFNIVFVLVVVFTIIQAPTLPTLARLLRLTPPHIGLDLQVELAPLDTMDADLIHVTIEPGSRLHGVYLTELRLPPPAAATLIVRGDDTFVPDAHTRLHTGDELVVLTTPHVREATEQRLRAVARAGRLASWFGDTGRR
ncbi:potassium/proton antiporter [Catellatospora sichuanensis]|uniref:potassium/proton antiporter n=1 Tax=Catellatospora sichuanensis TaxID=1969805 RepID=UPI001182D8C1|nr:potassium/proton antiporter [Catellatospora sichuanensis]